MSEWISVKDRLPKSRRKVLVYAGNYIFVVAKWDNEEKLWRTAWNHDVIETCYVTHWQPLPELPGEEVE